MAQGGSNRKIANKLVVASCAAVLAVYVAGYARTQAAADRLAAQVAERRAAVPAPQRVTFEVPELRSLDRIPERIPDRLRLPAAPLPDRARNTTDIRRKEAERVEVATVVVPGTIAEPAPIESPEPPLAIV